jgi:competence protein ComEC
VDSIADSNPIERCRHPERGSAMPSALSVAAALLAGSLLALNLARLPAAGWMLGLLAIAVWQWLRPSHRWIRYASAVLVGFCLSGLHGLWALSERLPAALEGVDLALEVRLEGLPQARAGLTRFDATIVTAEGEAKSLAGRRIRLAWYGTAPAFSAGQRWQFTARLKRPRGVLNPGGFDFERWAMQHRIAATGYVRDNAGARMLGSGPTLDAWRLRMSGQIQTALAAQDSRFVRALALGDTRALNDADWQTLRATGLSHLLAISGFHVGVVAGFGALLVRLIWWLWPRLSLVFPRPMAAASVAMLAALCYAAAAGFALPTVRAMLMISVVLLARLSRRAQQPGQGFALAAVAVLLFDPLAILGAGFWLSFLGVGWLLWCLPAQTGAGWLRGLLSAQGIATLGLLPTTLWFFGQASVVGPVANLLAIPWVTLVVVPLTLLGLLLETLHAGLGVWLFQAASWAMLPLWRMMTQVASWPGASLWLPAPGWPVLVLAMASAFWLLLPRGTPGKPLAALLLLPLFWPQPHRPPPAAVDVYQIDVGQGLAIALLTERHALLFDAGAAFEGGLDLGEAAVVPVLQSLGVRRLDRLIVSHADNDHAGGAASVHSAYPEAMLLAPDGSGLAGQSCTAGEAWEWDGVRFEFLHPPLHFPYLKNDSSCVLRVEAGATRLLITGDIGEVIERRLVREQAAAIAADVLTVPHHGSRHSSSPDFVAAVAPRLALVSSGHRSRFGHPHPDVVQRYRQAGAQLEGSAEAGMIRLRLDHHGVGPVQRWRDRQRRFWHETATAIE